LSHAHSFRQQAHRQSQATIPGPVRKRPGLKAGDSVAFKFKNGLIYLHKARPVDHIFAGAVEETLKDEWLSTHDERAYRDL
jgi:bifunctional DNA-binding transcriptional regulator/antitoxin component of YhaV-PrlF toxin-antitoxin module